MLWVVVIRTGGKSLYLQKRHKSTPAEPEPKAMLKNGEVGQKDQMGGGAPAGHTLKQRTALSVSRSSTATKTCQLTAVRPRSFPFSLSSSLGKLLKAMQCHLPQSSKQAHWSCKGGFFMELAEGGLVRMTTLVEGPKGEHWGELQQDLKGYFIPWPKKVEINCDANKQIRQEFKWWGLSCLSSCCILLFSLNWLQHYWVSTLW